MNYIQIKQVGNLQSNLNTLSDSIYQTGQYLLTTNQGTQTFEGEKTFDDEVYFNTGVRIYGTVTGEAAVFSEGPFGVGTTNPQYTLEVRSEAANETASFLLAEGDGDTGGIEITTNTPSTYRTTITHDDTGLVFNTSSIRPYCFMDADVGIGTDTPATKLDVREENVGATTQIRVYNEDNNNTTTQTASLFLGPDSRGNGALIWAEKEHADFSFNPERDISIVFSPVLTNSQTEAMRITSGGNVGIGTTDPTYKLNVEDTGDCFVGVTAGASDTAAILFGDSANKSIGRVTYDNSTDKMYFGTDATTISKQRRMTIDSAGNVGIGTADPDALLEIFGNAAGSTLTALKLTNNLANNNSEGVSVQFAGNSNRIMSTIESRMRNTDSRSDLIFSTNDGSSHTSLVEYMRIDSAGYVGIGTNAPSAPLEVTSTTGGVIMPRMTTVQRDAIVSPTDGEIIYNTTTNTFQGRANGSWEDLH